jgi:hypothetical protein
LNSLAAIIAAALFLLTFFGSIFNTLSPAFSYSDEALVLLVFGLAMLGRRIRPEYFRILVLLVLFWIYTLFVSVFSSYYRGLGLTFLDLFLFSKPVLLYIGMMSLPSTLVCRFLSLVMPFTYLYLFSAFVMYFANRVVPIFEVTEQRFGFDTYSFIANNAGEFANLIFAAGILAFSVCRSSQIRLVSIGMMLFLSFASLRFKAMVLALLYVLLAVSRRIGLVQTRVAEVSPREVVTQSRVRLIYLLAIIPFGLALGAEQFSNYFLGELTPRLFLVQSAIAVASDFFPFGAGGGTFGSAVSKLSYSDLYYDLGFAGRWGLTEADGRFLSDSFWPMVIAQYGITGLGIVLAIYVMILRNVVQHWAPTYRHSIGAAMILVNLALSTLGSAILVGNLGVVLIVTLCFLLRNR